jgi:hypothetical protein
MTNFSCHTETSALGGYSENTLTSNIFLVHHIIFQFLRLEVKINTHVSISLSHSMLPLRLIKRVRQYMHVHHVGLKEY